MIQSTSNTELTSTAPMKDFTVAMNESMFTMLTKNVYTDTILAVMREWSTNAIDACVAANNPIHFDVNLPTLLDPKFAVRDYGTGLSSEDINGLFSTLGASTKRDSNEYNGTFGIGRMAGLAYGDAFTVKSFFNSKLTTYLISVNKGIPNTIILGEVDTTEDNGLEMSIVINKKDLTKFTSKAKELYEFFEHKPNLNIPVEYFTHDKSIKGANWFINPAYSGLSNSYNTIRIIMGNVAYVVNEDSISNDFCKLFRIKGTCMHLPLGAVSITPGREALNMDDMTIKSIESTLAEILKELPEKLHENFKDMSSDYTKITSFIKLRDTMGHEWRSVLNDIDLKLTSNHYKSNEYLKLPVIPLVKPTIQFSRYVTQKPFDKYSTVRVDNLIIVIQDARIYNQDVINNYKTDNAFNGNFVVLKMEKWVKDEAKIQEHVDKCKAYIKELGNPPHFQTSTLIEAAPTSTGPKQVTPKAPVGMVDLRIDVDDAYVSTVRGSAIAVSDKHTYYYVKTNALHIDNMQPEELSLYVRAAKLYNAALPTKDKIDKKIRIVGIPKAGMKIIKDDKRFIPLEGQLMKEFATLKLINYTIHKITNRINDRDFKRIIKILPDHKLAKWASATSKYITENSKYDKIAKEVGLAEKFKCTEILPTTLITTQDVLETYPLLLKMFQYMEYHIDDEDIKKYVELVDSAEKGQ